MGQQGGCRRLAAVAAPSVARREWSPSRLSSDAANRRRLSQRWFATTAHPSYAAHHTHHPSSPTLANSRNLSHGGGAFGISADRSRCRRFPELDAPMGAAASDPQVNGDVTCNIDTGDSVKVKQILDECTVKAVLDRGYEEHHSLDNAKLWLMVLASTRRI